MINKHDSLAKACKQLCLKEPFYGLFLMMLNKEWNNTKVPSAGVSKNGINYQLTVNENFWNGLTELWQLMIMKHELLHISFFHLENQDRFPDKVVANIAMDIEINQYIDPSWLPCFDVTTKEFEAKYTPIGKKLAEDVKDGVITMEEYTKQSHAIPPRGVYIQDFPELKLEPKKGTKYYYDKLMQGKEQKEKTGSSGSSALDSLLDQMDSGQPTVCDHGTWKEFEAMSETEKKLLRSQTDFHLKEVADAITKSRGTIPSELADYISKIDHKEPPKFDWKGYLRRFTGGSTKIYTKKLHRKYNKRFEDNPGLKIKQKRHVLVAVDTSGSVSKNELEEFFHEIYHIHKGGTEVTVVQCDAAIAKIEPFKKDTADKIKVHGRGGTSFDPPCDYFNENPHKYSCMIYFTDGEAPAPVNKIRGKILWVLSSTSNLNDELPGLKIKLN